MAGLGQLLLLQGINLIGKSILTRNRASKHRDITREAIKKLDEIKEAIDNETEQISEIITNSNNVDINNLNDEVIEDIEEVKEPYSNYAPEMSVDTSCIACARAHILAVKGMLNEALRFAREDGVAHPEVINRLDSSGEELVMLERFDWTPEKIQNSPVDEQEIVREALPKVRRLRQQVLNGINSSSDLEKAASLSADIYSRIRQKGGE
ncbi:hypothetical protein [Orenia marismortui]|uniref:Uncharacterized protein n=1 Tax=Orenia marismortui TaxID=46469 RepID=A0A4R8GYA4_9FIRM|nr:hypothetical protein [Orenia marismortui]TDX48841.1 hypothetical protein C7959_12520 [Orenia marismortui]